MLQLGKPYATCVGYDETLLIDLHVNSLFGAIPQINKLRSFLLVADDGEIRLGDATDAPAEKFPGSTAASHYYTAAAVEREVAGVIRRSALRLLPQMLSGVSTFGIGSGSTLLPSSVSAVRPVLLFVRPREEDVVYLKVSEYSNFNRDDAGVAQVNAALASTARPAPIVPYGAKVEQIKKMYAEYVPVQYVPDKYLNPTGGKSGYIRPTVAEMMLPAAERDARLKSRAAEVTLIWQVTLLWQYYGR